MASSSMTHISGPYLSGVDKLSRLTSSCSSWPNSPNSLALGVLPDKDDFAAKKRTTKGGKSANSLLRAHNFAQWFSVSILFMTIHPFIFSI
jgi:hypothetical protein